MSEVAGGLTAEQKVERFKRMLRDLKKGAGLTPERAGGNTLRFMRNLGTPTANDSYKLLRATLDSMDRGHDYVQALLNAYGGEWLADDLNARRGAFAAEHGITMSRVKDLEEIGIQEFYHLLMRCAQDTEPTASDTEDSSIKELLLGLTQAVKEQTAVLREISAKLDHR